MLLTTCDYSCRCSGCRCFSAPLCACHSLLWQFSIYIYLVFFFVVACVSLYTLHMSPVCSPCVVPICDGYDLSYLINVKNVRFAHRFPRFYFVSSIKPLPVLQPNKNKYRFPKTHSGHGQEAKIARCNTMTIKYTWRRTLCPWYTIDIIIIIIHSSSVHAHGTLHTCTFANAVRDWTARHSQLELVTNNSAIFRPNMELVQPLWLWPKFISQTYSRIALSRRWDRWWRHSRFMAPDVVAVLPQNKRCYEQITILTCIFSLLPLHVIQYLPTSYSRPSPIATHRPFRCMAFEISSRTNGI